MFFSKFPGPLGIQALPRIFNLKPPMALSHHGQSRGRHQRTPFHSSGWTVLKQTTVFVHDISQKVYAVTCVFLCLNQKKIECKEGASCSISINELLLIFHYRAHESFVIKTTVFLNSLLTYTCFILSKVPSNTVVYIDLSIIIDIYRSIYKYSLWTRC